jgi:hypothetical protein
MRRLIFMLLILGSVPGLTLAQATDPHHGQGYAFVAPGGASGGGATVTTLHIGGGGEGLLYKGLGVGGELGYWGPTKSFGDGVGLLSVNGSYHVLPRNSDRKVVPFVTAGYSLAFRSATANLFNFGGGINYWISKRVGLRLEFRDHVWFAGPLHYWGFRIGVAFR